ncbi:hypothetical protein [Streptomyces sp. NPDC091268]|uniref:hypothetical protein n=1 Tax=Streptomyces sp. NPDC091268 TaxID=3365979 RepID=UPI0038068B1E
MNQPNPPHDAAQPNPPHDAAPDQQNPLTLALTAAERAELADLADAAGLTPEACALGAVRAHLRAERDRVGQAAARLAERHSALLNRLGQ